MELIYNPIPAKEIGDRFYNLIYAAYQKTGQRVVILIDEYDKPMLDTMHDSPLLESIKVLSAPTSLRRRGLSQTGLQNVYSYLLLIFINYR